MKRVEKKHWKKVEHMINGVQEGEWEVVEVTVDSGAVTTVGPKDVATAFPLEETEESRAGRKFYAANGSPIDNYGRRRTEVVVGEGHQVNLSMQVAEVVKVLGYLTVTGAILSTKLAKRGHI